MKKIISILCACTISLFLVTNTFALPTYTPEVENVFEFQDWERALDTNDDPIADDERVKPGYTFEGIFDASEIYAVTDPGNPTWQSTTGDGEITGWFDNLTVGTERLDGTTLYQQFDTSNSFVEIYFDPDNDLNLNSTLTTAKNTATDGQKLLKLEWAEYEAITENAGDGNVLNDVTNVNAKLDLFTGTNSSDWAWNDPDMWIGDQYVSEDTNATTVGPYDFDLALEVFNTNDTRHNDVGWNNFTTSDDFSGFPVPEPTTMLLFGTGLVGLACFGRKKLLK